VAVLEGLLTALVLLVALVEVVVVVPVVVVRVLEHLDKDMQEVLKPTVVMTVKQGLEEEVHLV
jgi:hypothetical protein